MTWYLPQNIITTVSLQSLPPLLGRQRTKVDKLSFAQLMGNSPTLRFPKQPCCSTADSNCQPDGSRASIFGTWSLFQRGWNPGHKLVQLLEVENICFIIYMWRKFGWSELLNSEFSVYIFVITVWQIFMWNSFKIIEEEKNRYLD